ncbi:MAG: hypothetical protein RLZZ507_684 [Cyanobacteriota bacterium]|jgi:hypothetical protein
MTHFTSVGKRIKQFTQTAFAGLALFVTFSTLASPVFAESLQVGDKSFEIIDDMPIVINRNATDEKSKLMEVTKSNGRYQFISFLPALTQEKTVASAATSLYRLAEVQDLTTGQKLKVALPIVFKP